MWADGETTFAGTILARGGEQAAATADLSKCRASRRWAICGIADMRAPHWHVRHAAARSLQHDYQRRDAIGSFDATGTYTNTDRSRHRRLAIGTLLTATRHRQRDRSTTNGAGHGARRHQFCRAPIVWHAAIHSDAHARHNDIIIRSKLSLLVTPALATWSFARTVIGHGCRNMSTLQHRRTCRLDANSTGTRFGFLQSADVTRCRRNFCRSARRDVVVLQFCRSAASSLRSCWSTASTDLEHGRSGLQSSMGNYALGRDIDAQHRHTQSVPVSPSGYFRREGSSTGQNHTISNVNLTGPRHRSAARFATHAGQLCHATQQAESRHCRQATRSAIGHVIERRHSMVDLHRHHAGGHGRANAAPSAIHRRRRT